jgi:hypothetical protein
MNIDPVLMCGRCAAPTLHIFLERRPQARRPGELPYVDFIYECDRCEMARAWGNEPREETVYGRRLAEAIFAHAMDSHGMRRDRCPVCHGAGLDCQECGDEGETWIFTIPGPCGPACPIGDLNQPVTE